jgi:hypothetical protein
MISGDPTVGLGPEAPAASTKLYFGVLKQESSLARSFGTRVIPLRSPDPKFLFVVDRYVKVVEIHYNDLSEGHRRNLMEWVDMYIPSAAEFVKQTIAETGVYSAPWEYFSGIVSGEQKEEAVPQ